MGFLLLRACFVSTPTITATPTSTIMATGRPEVGGRVRDPIASPAHRSLFAAGADMLPSGRGVLNCLRHARGVITVDTIRAEVHSYVGIKYFT